MQASLAATTQYLDDTVCQQRFPVIVGVNLDANAVPQHYVLVTGKEGSDFLIADPFFSKLTLGDYNNDFETRGFVPDPLETSVNLTSLWVTTRSCWL